MATPVNALFITAANTLFYCLLCSAPAGHLCMLIFSEIHAAGSYMTAQLASPSNFLARLNKTAFERLG